MQNGFSCLHKNGISARNEAVSVVLSIKEQGDEIEINLSRQESVKSGGSANKRASEEMSLSGLDTNQVLEIVKLLEDWLESESFPSIEIELDQIEGVHSWEGTEKVRGKLTSAETEFTELLVSISEHSVEFAYWHKSHKEWRNISVPCSEVVENDLPQGIENVEKLYSTFYDFFTVEYDGEIDHFNENVNSSEATAVHKIEKIFNRFGEIALPLRERRSDKEPLEMNDEADVQYLLHGLLKLDFDDVRREPHTERHSSVSPRIDFLIQDETIGIEVKRASPTRQEKALRKELSEDKEQYRLDTNIDTLLMFIYDPEKQIENKAEFESSFEQETPQMETRVTVTR